ncbi:hypothetical protein [Hymenobacter glacialis]|uniref:Uncharacterized protein n=1 Tax=Hymenobacter glacialis TaxID=1908236 RepID=A0A1G1SX78_9BACT|nr:hypothetical protein [Hymenobacter glacialis]OGX83199.1 hypothetical protein BEN48_17270 [Hymenobacter glacialis]
MSPLTPADLATLLTAVPFPVQQRDEAVGLCLGPGLNAIYRGPVALADVRMALSPWHWLGGELAHSPRSEYLRESVAAATARDSAPDLDTVEGVAAWVWAVLATTELEWYPVPGDADEWGQWSPTDEAEAGTGSFLPPGLEVPAVLFTTDNDLGGDGRIVVAQVRWQGANGAVSGPVGIYASSGRVAAAGSAYPAWLMGWGAVLLTDPATGEQAELSPRWTEVENSGGASDEDHVDAGKVPELGEWVGQEPRYEAGTFYKTDSGQEPDWLREGLHYAAGRLLRADTGRALALMPYLLPETRPH